ncbi:unnamed protein product [Cochlearia groenlandica]
MDWPKVLKLKDMAALILSPNSIATCLMRLVNVLTDVSEVLISDKNKSIITNLIEKHTKQDLKDCLAPYLTTLKITLLYKKKYASILELMEDLFGTFSAEKTFQSIEAWTCVQNLGDVVLIPLACPHQVKKRVVFAIELDDTDVKTDTDIEDSDMLSDDETLNLETANKNITRGRNMIMIFVLSDGILRKLLRLPMTGDMKYMLLTPTAPTGNGQLNPSTRSFKVDAISVRGHENVLYLAHLKPLDSDN